MAEPDIGDQGADAPAAAAPPSGSTAADASAPSAGGQSLIAQAIEETSRVTALWTQSLTGFAVGEADRLASGHYSYADLLTAPVRLLRVVVKVGVETSELIPDNLALLAAGVELSGQEPAAIVRRQVVELDVPAGVGGPLTTTPLTGTLHGAVVPRSRIRVVPPSVQAVAARVELVTVEIQAAGVPNDTYVGSLRTPDGRAQADISVAIDELGDPLP